MYKVYMKFGFVLILLGCCYTSRDAFIITICVFGGYGFDTLSLSLSLFVSVECVFCLRILVTFGFFYIFWSSEFCLLMWFVNSGIVSSIENRSVVSCSWWLNKLYSSLLCSGENGDFVVCKCLMCALVSVRSAIL